MEIKLNSIDMLQIAKALKCGWLDLDKIESFRSLVEGYNPPKEIKQDELDYYLDCLYDGWGYTPASEEQVREAMSQGLSADLQEKWKRQIGNGQLYRRLVREAFLGLIAMKALGGTFQYTERTGEQL